MTERPFSFDRIAPAYDFLGYLAFGGTLRRAQQHFLSVIPPHSHVLVIGGGSGKVVLDLLDRAEVHQLTYVEASAVMLRRAERRITNYQQAKPNVSVPPVTFINGTERDIPSSEKYRVVITNFVLDMYEGNALDRMMQQIDALLWPDAYWLFTDFRYSSQSAQRWWQKPLAGLMYLFFKITANILIQALPNYDTHFDRLGWKAEQHHSFFGDFITSQVYRRTTEPTQDGFSSDSR
ncbi:MAG: class I SAM-dependent methyltransferase [Bacteroidota bacterium]